MNNKDTLIYVVSHNHEKYLEQCLDSIFFQVDSESEVILIDSGSSDSSSHILKNYSERYDVKFYSKKLILTHIIDWVYEEFLDKYKYIMRVDADDALRSGAITSLKKNIKKNNKIGSVSGSWMEIDENSQTLNKMILEKGQAIEAFHGACTLFRTKALKGIFFAANNICAQDGLYTWLSIKNEWVCMTMPDLIFQYRRHTKNMSNNEDNLFANRKIVYKSIFSKKNIKKKCCAIIGYQEGDEATYEVKINSNFETNLSLQLDYLDKSDAVDKVFISSNSNIIKRIDLKKYKNIKQINRTSSNSTLIKSLQNCDNLKKTLTNYTDIIILNPLKHIWKDYVIDISVYSKYIHSWSSVIACNLIKGAVFENNLENNTLDMVNFSDTNTAITSKFLYVRIPGFILLSYKDFYNFKNDIPGPIGHVSDNFLTMGLQSL